jgi:hypothetical protein
VTDPDVGGWVCRHGPFVKGNARSATEVGALLVVVVDRATIGARVVVGTMVPAAEGARVVSTSPVSELSMTRKNAFHTPSARITASAAINTRSIASNVRGDIDGTLSNLWFLGVER